MTVTYECEWPQRSQNCAAVFLFKFSACKFSISLESPGGMDGELYINQCYSKCSLKTSIVCKLLLVFDLKIETRVFKKLLYN